jgi:hypothetical protein
MAADQGMEPGLEWLGALRDPQPCLEWDLAAWEGAIRQARRQRLLGRLGHAVSAAGLLDQVPPQAARHLVAEQRYADWRCAMLGWVLECCAPVLAGAPYPIVLLKGAAYVAQGLPIGRGRLPSDVDIMVPRDALADAQSRLAQADWTPAPMAAHDLRYYRDWSHELPPLQHPQHGLELDLHHNILPPVCRTPVDAQRLFEGALPIAGTAWHALHPVDQVLHSAAHLFHDAEHSHRLRDLVDIDGLLRQHATDPGFGRSLAARAHELGLRQPLALALHFCAQWLQTPLPAGCLAEATRLQWSEASLLAPLLARVLGAAELDREPGWGHRLSALLLQARYHHWRMPVRLLAQHVWHKSMLRRR